MNAVSLFSGVEGFGIGFARAGIETVLQAEQDPWCLEVLARHYPNTKRVTDVRLLAPGDDVVGIDVRLAPPTVHTGVSVEAAQGEPPAVLVGVRLPLVDDVGDPLVPAAKGGVMSPLRVGRSPVLMSDDVAVQDRGSTPTLASSQVDLLYGGFPCQPFSVAGKRAGEADERNLWPEFRRIVSLLRPRWVVAENVPGLLSQDRGRYFGTIISDLVQLGYGVAWRILDAQFFGVPQRRRRVFIVASYDAGDGAGTHRAEQVLSLCEGCGGNPAAGETAGEGVAGTLGGGAGERGWSPDTDRMTFIPTTALQTAYFDRNGPLSQDELAFPLDVASGPQMATHAVAVSLRGREGGGTAELGGDQSNALRASQGGGDKQHVLIASTLRGRSSSAGVNMPGRGGEEAYGDNLVPTIAWALQERDAKGPDSDTKVGRLLPSVAGVRRLTPRECERLMGWPEILHVMGDNIDDICRAWEGSGTEAGAAQGVSDLLRAVWVNSAGAAAPRGHPGSARVLRGSLSGVPRSEAFGAWQLGERTGSREYVCDLRVELSTEQAKALHNLFGPELSSRDGSQIGNEAVGCISRLEGWTQYAADGREISDSHRYRQCGNGVVAPVAEWIGHRLIAVDSWTEAQP